MKSAIGDILLTKQFRITAEKKRGLETLGIATVRDLLYHFPTRFEEPGKLFIGELKKGESVIIEGEINSIRMRKTGGKRRVMVAEATVRSGIGKVVPLMWFHQPYIAKQFQKGDTVRIQGVVSGTTKQYITNPTIQKTSAFSNQINETLTRKEKVSESFIPIYPTTKGISSAWIRSKIESLLYTDIAKQLDDILPLNIQKELHLPSLYDALITIHKPRKKTDYEVAQKRFIFEVMFVLQVTQQYTLQKRSQEQVRVLPVKRDVVKTFMKEHFTFTPTKAQYRVVDEILDDLMRDKPMARLLEGDVGSGKTAVAATILYATVTAKKETGTVAENIVQTAYMTPTELLARQQFETIIALFGHLPIQIGLITGKQCLKFPSKVNSEQATKISRSQLKKWIQNGEITILVGTHALIQKSISFRRLSLVIIDEQHRFGVAQRKQIIKQGIETPHLLSMTATPIPRTLALTLYGDLSLSVLDELPVGRKPVKTTLINDTQVTKVYDHIQSEVTKGHQAYILCPRIDDDEETLLRSVKEEYKCIQKDIFPNLSVAMLHGKMKSAEREEVMEKFTSGAVDVLVTTTVIEVGINIPNATTMVIFHAERFGLAQLHQLRGRVIRSEFQPYCFILSNNTSPITRDRLAFFAKTHNGFELAERDLEMRGTGELIGARQSGIPDIAMDALKNKRLVTIAQNQAKKLIAKDPMLKKHPYLFTRVQTSDYFSE